MSFLEHLKMQFAEAGQVLDRFVSDSSNLLAIEKAGFLMVDALKAGNKIIACGNGGSMCDAMHFAEELTGRFREDRPPVSAVAISDPSHLSCVANDYGYEQVFSRYLQAVGRKGDTLLAISTSGNSANVVAAAIKAREMEVKVVGLTGKDGGKLKDLCDVEIRAPHTKYADRAQEIHIKVIHSLINFIEQNLFSTQR